MIRICIFVPECAVMQAVADPQYLFTTVNHFLQAEGKPPAFSVKLTGMRREISVNSGLYTIHTDVLLAEAESDLLIVPAVIGDFGQVLAANADAVPLIVEKYRGGTEVASLCVGAFLLASTGLLNGRSCSTHWGFAGEFNAMFPQVRLVDGAIVTEEQGIYTSGGANSYWNLLLHLVEKHCGREMAVKASKYFAIDIGRTTQSPFSIFKGQKTHNDDGIRTAQDFIEKNFNGRITIEQLADMAAIGRRTFERRFRQATGNSVLSYIHRVKMEAAKRALEAGRKNVSEVMYDVGYTDTKAFRAVFRKVTGLTPLEYRNRYTRIAAR
jgi:transcriptional regulator GlxA family with amidase domain